MWWCLEKKERDNDFLMKCTVLIDIIQTKYFRLSIRRIFQQERLRKSSINSTTKFIFQRELHCTKNTMTMHFLRIYFYWSEYGLRNRNYAIINMICASVIFHKRDGSGPSFCLAIPLFLKMNFLKTMRNLHMQFYLKGAWALQNPIASQKSP